MQNTIPKQDTQARLNAYEERLFDIAFNLGCECEQLRDIADETGLARDKDAYVAKMHELRLAAIAHREAVYLCNLYANLGTKR